MGNDRKLRKQLAQIKTEQDFEKILDQEFRLFMGSRRRCAEELKKLAPKKKHIIIEKTMRQLSRDKNWNLG
jgi:hypothetical protein